MVCPVPGVVGVVLIWVTYYESCIDEWNAMQDLESERPDSQNCLWMSQLMGKELSVSLKPNPKHHNEPGS